MSQPPRTVMRTIVALAGACLAGLYLSNLGAGVFGEVPDAFPLIGNLDEVLASAVLFSCLSYLGINVVPNRWQANVPPRPESLDDQQGRSVETR